MEAVILQVIAGNYGKYSKNSRFLSVNTYKKCFVGEYYCIAHHDADMCFSTNCRFDILMQGSLEELRQKLDPLCFTYQHVDCLYTLFKSRFRGKLLSRVVECLITCKEQSILVNRGV